MIMKSIVYMIPTTSVVISGQIQTVFLALVIHDLPWGSPIQREAKHMSHEIGCVAGNRVSCTLNICILVSNAEPVSSEVSFLARLELVCRD